MKENTKNTLLIMELLSGLLLHDIANSMNGIMFGLEEFEDGDKQEALSLIKESFNHLLAQYKVMKQAYSISDDNLNFCQTESNIHNYLLNKKIKFTWKTSSFTTATHLIEKINKIISSMVLTISTTMADVEQISILLSEVDGRTLLTIKISNEHKTLSRYLVDKFTNKDNPDLDTKNINTYLVLLLLEHYNTKVNFNCEDSFIEMVFYLIHT